MMSLSRFSRLSRPIGLRSMATTSFKVKPNVDPNVKYTKVTATWRQLCDFELIANGGFAPLGGFLKRKDYESVCANFRLSDGKLWPIPIVFDIDAETKAHLESNEGKILITDAKGTARGVLHVEEIWRPDKKAEGQLVYGGNPDHCEIININDNIHEFYAGGKVEVLSLPEYEDYRDLRRSPSEVRQFFKDNKWDKVVAFQTRNPMHFAHIELTKVAAQRIGAKLFLNPVVGPTKPGDIDYHTRMRCYHAVLNEYPKGHVLLNTLPLAMRMGGPREAMLHALIRKNHGATHFIIGRDHAGPGSDSTGKDIYGPYEARDFLEKHKEEVGISPVPFEEMVYIEKEKKYFPRSQVPEGVKPLKISGTDVRRMLKTGEPIPEWFSPPRVVKILREATLNNSLDVLSEQFKDAHPSELVKHVLQEYGKDVAISFSGAEDVILIQYAKQSGLPFRVFSLDTGRLHPETYEFFEKVEQHYGIRIEYTFPDAEQTKALVQEKGMFSFYKDGHQECCGVRKVTPLKGKLSELKAWITGVRKDQSQTRVDMKLAQVDPVFQGKDGGMLVKFNPLANMKGKDLWNEINLIEVPYNPLHSHGFISIGCQPCTRPTNPGMHEREGRWWWENAATKECGLHKACDDESPK